MIPVDGLDGRGGAAGDDVHVGAVGDQQRQPALRDGTATDDDDLPAGQAQADEVGVLGHPASLEVAAAATKRVAARGCAAGWVCRYDACTPRSTAPSRTVGHVASGKDPRGWIVVGERDCGAVEFVPHGALADRVQSRVGHGDGVAVAEREAVGEPRRSGQHPAHRIPVEVVDQIGQPCAFGVYRRAAGGQIVDLLTHNVVGGQFGAELLGETAGQHQRGGLRRQRVGQRIEFDDLGPCGAQQFGVFGVAEAERLTCRQRDGDVRGRGRRRRPDPTAAPSSDWRPRASMPATSTWRRHQFGHRVDGRPGLLAVFDGGDQAEMPGRDGQFVGARDRAEHRHARVFAGLPQHLLVPRRADPVEDHPGDPRTD